MKLRESNIQKLTQGDVRCPDHRRWHQRRGLRRRPVRQGRTGGAGRSARFRRLHQPAVVESGLGRHQVSGEPRLRAGPATVPEPQPPDPQLSVASQGNPLSGDHRPRVPFSSSVSLGGRLGVLAVRERLHQNPAPAFQADDPAGRAGASTPAMPPAASSTPTPTCTTTTPASCSSSCARPWIAAASPSTIWSPSAPAARAIVG